MAHFGRFLRKLLSERGLSMAQAAELSGVSLATIKRAVQQKDVHLQDRNIAKLAPHLMLTRADFEEAWEAEKENRPWRPASIALRNTSIGYGPVYKLSEIRRRDIEGLLIQWAAMPIRDSDVAFCFCVEDDAMSPFYLANDVVTVVFPKGTTGIAPGVTQGTDCLVEKRNDDGSFERLLGRVFFTDNHIIVAGIAPTSVPLLLPIGKDTRALPVTSVYRRPNEGKIHRGIM